MRVYTREVYLGRQGLSIPSAGLSRKELQGHHLPLDSRPSHLLRTEYRLSSILKCPKGGTSQMTGTLGLVKLGREICRQMKRIARLDGSMTIEYPLNAEYVAQGGNSLSKGFRLIYMD
jgi:hypothetical protein